MIREIDNRIKRALGSIRLAFRGVAALVKAAGAVQLVQLDALQGEQLQDAELFQHYGMTSNPPAGTMAIVLPIGGRTAHGIVIATEHGSYRLKSLASGEVALYSRFGQVVKLRQDGGIDFHAPGDIDLRGDNVRLHGESSLIFECKGHGQKWLPNRVDTWQIGEVAGTPNALNGTQIP